MTMTSVRYDFGRCTVEHVGSHTFQAPAWGADVGSIALSRPGVVIRLGQAQYEHDDEALFTMLDTDARELAKQILELLGDDK